MLGRIFRKSCRMAWRSGKRFYGWVVFYTILTLTVGYFLQQAFDNQAEGQDVESNFSDPVVQVTLVILLAGGFSYFYANQLVGYRRREIATLKCIGWSNGDVYKLITSEIFLVTGLAFLIVFELAVHVFGIGVIASAFDQTIIDRPPITPNTLAWTAVLVIGIQFVPAILAIRKILNIEPITALRNN